jgi:pilus assembly protein CpaE
MVQAHILVVDDSRPAATIVAEYLTKIGHQVTVKANAVEALNWLHAPCQVPDLIISDVMMPEMSGYEFVRQVRAIPPNDRLPIILLTAKGDLAERLAGFEAGADDYLVKPVNAAELRQRVDALLSRKQAMADCPESTIITVFSLRGGVGTTSMAVNLSIALAHLWNIRVLLADMALKNGHCAMMLNLAPTRSPADLAREQRPTFDSEAIEPLLLNHESGVQLLPAPVSPAEAELITPALVDRLWPYFCATYPFVVIDAGSELNELTLAILSRSHIVLLMLAPELGSLKAATDAIQILKRLHLETTQILPVINWTFSHDGLTQKSIEAALDRPAVGVIPYARTAFTRAINTRRPILTTDPTTQASLAIASLAYDLSSAKIKAGENHTGNPSQLLTWVRKLAKAA